MEETPRVAVVSKLELQANIIFFTFSTNWSVHSVVMIFCTERKIITLKILAHILQNGNTTDQVADQIADAIVWIFMFWFLWKQDKKLVDS